MSRTIGSLQHRWSTIQECCNKWKSCLAQVARQHPSGVPLQEQANLAQERYKAMDQQKHRPFTMQHCWTLLQNNQKWIDREFECPPKKPRSNCSSSTDFEAHEEDEGTDEMSKRPAGRKKEKDRSKKDAGGYKEAIQKMIESKEKLAVDKDSRWTEIKAIEERKVAIEERKVAAEERKAANEEERLRLKGEKARAQAAAEERKAAAKKKDEDQKIMFMDTSALDDTQRAYVEAMRAKILAKILGGSGSGSV
ncbi:caldesmon-like isoform X1 [Panicum virgatum]|nr:caldesmon-like isoform X1 [Panicum virgatum]